MAEPTYIAHIPEGTDVSAYEVGLALLGYPATPQGRLVAGVLEARDEAGLPLYPTVAVMMPRRTTKTTAVWAVLIGRCTLHPGHRVVTTAQDGTRAGNTMREKMREMEAHGFEDAGGRLRWSNGRERIEFENGSVIWVVAPNAGAFRSEASDCELFDEAGELSLDRSADLLAGALPLLDTRPMGQAIVAGTPAKQRAGLLWETLGEGRRALAAAAAGEVVAEDGTGIVDYSLRDDEELVVTDEEGQVVGLDEGVLRRVHPGIGTLTTMAKMRARFAKLGRAKFEMEYGCRFPADSTTTAVDLEKWAGGQVAPVERPDRVGIAFDCAYDGSSASIVYAWRLDGVAYVEVAAHRLGTSWVARAAHTAAGKYRRVPVAYDSIGANLDPATAMTRLKPTPKTDALTMKAIMAAAQRLVAEIHEDRLRHFGQADLDAAVANTAWRDIAQSGRAFGTKDPTVAINPIVAASLALWSYDKGRERLPLEIVA